MKAAKYTIVGTSVLVIDERTNLRHADGRPADDRATRSWATRQLANMDYGIGCRIVTFLNRLESSYPQRAVGGSVQKPLEKVAARPLEMRAFLASGHPLNHSTSACCAAAEYLYHTESREQTVLISPGIDGRTRTQIVTRDAARDSYALAVGQPEPMPDLFVNSIYDLVAEPLPNLAYIEALRPSVVLSHGVEELLIYAVYIGEPYLVCLVDSTPGKEQSNLLIDVFEQPITVQKALFDRIVAHMNGVPPPTVGSNLAVDFPPSLTYDSTFGMPFAEAGIFQPDQGVSMVFARVQPPDQIDACFYHRGTQQEVRFSGIGAVAATVVAHGLNLIERPQAVVRSWRNIVEGRNTSASVERVGETWWLQVGVEELWTGKLGQTWTW